MAADAAHPGVGACFAAVCVYITRSFRSSPSEDGAAAGRCARKTGEAIGQIQQSKINYRKDDRSSYEVQLLSGMYLENEGKGS